MLPFTPSPLTIHLSHNPLSSNPPIHPHARNPQFRHTPHCPHCRRPRILRIRQMILQHRIPALTYVISRMTKCPHPRTLHPLDDSPVVRIAE